MLSGIMLSGGMLSGVMLSGFMLGVVMLSVAAPSYTGYVLGLCYKTLNAFNSFPTAINLCVSHCQSLPP